MMNSTKEVGFQQPLSCYQVSLVRPDSWIRC